MGDGQEPAGGREARATARAFDHLGAVRQVGDAKARFARINAPVEPGQGGVMRQVGTRPRSAHDEGGRCRSDRQGGLLLGQNDLVLAGAQVGVQRQGDRQLSGGQRREADRARSARAPSPERYHRPGLPRGMADAEGRGSRGPQGHGAGAREPGRAGRGGGDPDGDPLDQGIAGPGQRHAAARGHIAPGQGQRDVRGQSAQVTPFGRAGARHGGGGLADAADKARLGVAIAPDDGFVLHGQGAAGGRRHHTRATRFQDTRGGPLIPGAAACAGFQKTHIPVAPVPGVGPAGPGIEAELGAGVFADAAQGRVLKARPDVAAPDVGIARPGEGRQRVRIGLHRHGQLVPPPFIGCPAGCGRRGRFGRWRRRRRRGASGAGCDQRIQSLGRAGQGHGQGPPGQIGGQAVAGFHRRQDVGVGGDADVDRRAPLAAAKIARTHGASVHGQAAFARLDPGAARGEQDLARRAAAERDAGAAVAAVADLGAVRGKGPAALLGGCGLGRKKCQGKSRAKGKAGGGGKKAHEIRPAVSNTDSLSRRRAVCQPLLPMGATLTAAPQPPI